MPAAMAATRVSAQLKQDVTAAPARARAFAAAARPAHPAGCRCPAHGRRAVTVRAAGAEVATTNGAAAQVFESNGKQIVVEPNGTIIIGPGNGAAISPADVRETAEVEYLTARVNKVQEQFGNAMGADDFMQRVEMALYAFGFNGDNSIAMVNLCRDEVTVTLKQRIEHVFGSSFSTNGLGGVLTCGVTGIGAGLSHSPLCGTTGKERYVFFSFPHISINASGEVGPMSRPGRPGQSCACGALIKSWNEIRAEGLTCNCKIPGVHAALDPEYSILKQRIARRLRHEGATDESVKSLNLTDVTKVAERTISDDLEFLISQAVDPKKADYAVITGVQIHNWANNFEDDSPNLEFVAPTAAYVVVNGVKTHVDLSAVPPLTPRQTKLINGTPDLAVNQGGAGVLMEEQPDFSYDSKEARRTQRDRLQKYLRIMKQDDLEGVAGVTSPTWQAKIVTAAPARAESDNSTFIDQQFSQNKELADLQAKLQAKYAMPSN
ncbi:low-CO2 inducible [Chlorella sorokiniana]|uniref:Low-CO2 inducible n=1 Tax=Chlorella sorokiniana TaxID=3076 RepID=A0A2P6TH80_CHLSO|nr:low-CO2 inducible [Chlorella sorokiniana]|eukprot:PRW33647.1 low-CO2 inducible [Chlorella sorokiniana]